MDARGWKRALARGGLTILCLASMWIVAGALPSMSPWQLQLQLQTQREATITALKTAIAAGHDGIGPLPSVFIDDDEDTQEDDPMMRALWLRLQGGPILQQSVVTLLGERTKQLAREQAYSASAK